MNFEGNKANVVRLSIPILRVGRFLPHLKTQNFRNFLVLPQLYTNNSPTTKQSHEYFRETKSNNQKCLQSTFLYPYLIFRPTSSNSLKFTLIEACPAAINKDDCDWC